MLTVEISLPDIEELKALVQEGQDKGYLTRATHRDLPMESRW